MAVELNHTIVPEVYASMNGRRSTYAAAKAGIALLTGRRRPGGRVRDPRQLHHPGNNPHRGQPGPDPGRAASIARRRAPPQRLGTPQDVATAAAFLASDGSAWITGVVLDVAGGAVLV
jgi:3-oxoacyl-[acyl-carrier protein] reductase